jgi:hypothetical protein
VATAVALTDPAPPRRGWAAAMVSTARCLARRSTRKAATSHTGGLESITPGKAGLGRVTRASGPRQGRDPTAPPVAAQRPVWSDQRAPYCAAARRQVISRGASSSTMTWPPSSTRGPLTQRVRDRRQPRRWRW